MRSHGVSDFPDPSSNGAIAIAPSPGSGLNDQSPAFQAALKAWRSLAQATKAGRAGVSAADRQQLLAYAACMRSS
jgi:hypothetical protein